LSWKAALATEPDEILAKGEVILEEFNQDDFKDIEVTHNLTLDRRNKGRYESCKN